MCTQYKEYNMAIQIPLGGEVKTLKEFISIFPPSSLLLWLVFYKNNIYKIKINFDNIIKDNLKYVLTKKYIQVILYRHTYVLYTVQNVHLYRMEIVQNGDCTFMNHFK